jgi:hypothetical protein
MIQISMGNKALSSILASNILYSFRPKVKS